MRSLKEIPVKYDLADVCSLTALKGTREQKCPIYGSEPVRKHGGQRHLSLLIQGGGNVDL